jgi:Mrp family chromosome partitioning ATPase
MKPPPVTLNMTTNQAFIKAYRRDVAQPAPAAPASSFHRRAESLLSASVEYVSVVPAARAAICATPAVGDMTGASHFEVSPGSLQFAFPQSEAARRTTHAAPPTPAEPPTTAKRPLSAFSAARKVAQATSIERPPATHFVERFPVANSFRPGTTIASFRWPPICRALGQHCGKQFDDVADMLAATASTGRSLVGFISLFPGRGCTTLLLTAAARLAARGKRIVVVDGNFCRPQLASLLENEVDPTWHDVLADGIPVADAIVRALDDGVDLLPFDSAASAASAAENLAALSAGLHTSVTAGVLRHAYDLTLVDLGAFFDSESQSIGLELVRNMRIDGVLAVVGPQPADARDLDTLGAYIGERGGSLIGTVENRVAQ